MKLIKPFFLFLLPCLFWACGEAETETELPLSTEEATAATSFTHSELTAAYLKVKDALVDTDAAATGAAAVALVQAFNQSEAEEPQAILVAAKEIANSTEIEAQRTSFNALSEAMYLWLSQSAKERLGLYRQYCPMAFDNEGAFWLAAEREVNNPYFGDAMLHCGRVEDEL